MSKPETDLERRALLGDQEAQEELTRQGIALPCPCCGSDVIVNEIPPHKHTLATFMPDYEGGCFIECPSCNYANCGKTKHEALMNHNRRPAPPIGRCKDCAHSSPRMVMGNKTYGKVCKIDPYLVHEVNPDGYCDGFKPKEAPND